jgi:hypothetical protein
MNAKTRSLGAAFVAVLTAFALSACGPGDPIVGPAPTFAPPTESSTPEPEPTLAEPVPWAVVISAASVAVFDDDRNLMIDLPFTMNGTTAGNELAAALGATPEVVTYDAGDCYPAGSSFLWENLVLLTSGTAETAAGQVFEIQASGAQTDGGIYVFGPQSLEVGSSLAEVNAAVPGAISEFIEGGSGAVGLEAYTDANGIISGVRGGILDGALHTITAPTAIIPTC